MLSLLLTIVFTFLTALIDYEVLQYSYIYDHRSRWLQRALFFVVLSLYSVTGSLGGCLLFYALFDSVLNKLRGKELLYIGNTAIIDKFFNKRPLFFIIIKVLCLFVGIYLTLI